MIREKEFTVKTNVGSNFGTIEYTQRQYKPWLDHDDGGNVLFTSVHLFDNKIEISSSSDAPYKSTFYPGTGDLIENTTPTDEIYPGGIFNVPIGVGQMTSQQWRQQFTEKVFPRLVEFKPDIIFCSAGFDAHELDHIHGEGDTTITEFDYQWLTENL
jgi:acetoin utilization deacetylase AcuC-like enzyme